MLRTRKVHFTCIRAESNRRFERRVRQCQARGRMIMAKDVEQIMSPNELTVRLQKGRISRDGLVQQISRQQQILLPAIATACCQEKILGAIVKVEGTEVRGWRFLNCHLCCR